MDLDVEPGERQSTQFRREFSIPQITPSQYEYRISRMPARRRRRARPQQEPHDVKSFSEPDPIIDLTTSAVAHHNSPAELASESLASEDSVRKTQQAVENNTASLADVISQPSATSSTYVEQAEGSPVSDYHPSRALSPPIICDIDDLELLELGGHGNNTRSQGSTWDDHTALQVINDDSPQPAKRRKRTSKLADQLGNDSGRKAQKIRTETNQANEAARRSIPFGNQLIMVHNDSDEENKFEEDPVSSEDEDPIQDSQFDNFIDVRKPGRRQKSKSRKTIPGDDLRHQFKLPALPVRLPLKEIKSVRHTTSMAGSFSGHNADISDGFSGEERTLTTPISKPRRGTKVRNYWARAPVLDIQPKGQNGDETTDESLRTPPEYSPTVFDDVEDVASQSSRHADGIAGLVARMREREICRRDTGKKPAAQQSGRQTHPRDPRDEIGHEHNAAADLARNPPVAVQAQSVRKAARVMASRKPAKQKNRDSCRQVSQLELSRSTDHADDDGWSVEAPPSRGRHSITPARTLTPQHAFDRPGNLKAIRELVDHEEADEPIEDDGPDFAVPSRQLLRTPHPARGSGPVNGSRPMQTPNNQHTAIESNTITPRTAQAAYPTPHTSVPRPRAQAITDLNRVAPLAIIAHRNAYGDLVDDIIEEDAHDDHDRDSGAPYDRPVSAHNLSPVRYFANASAQLQQSSMLIDDSAELGWEGSTFNTPGQLPSFNTSFSLNHDNSADRPRGRTDEVSLKQLTRTVSSRWGTRSPEQVTGRTHSRLHTWRAPSKCKQGDE